MVLSKIIKSFHKRININEIDVHTRNRYSAKFDILFRTSFDRLTVCALESRNGHLIVFSNDSNSLNKKKIQITQTVHKNHYYFRVL